MIDPTVRLGRALSDRTRVRIVAALAARSLCVCELTHLLRAGQPLVSRHLAVLRAAGVVEDVRSGKWVEYRLARDGADGLAGAVLECVAERAATDPSLRKLSAAARSVDRRHLQGAARGPSPATSRTSRRRGNAAKAER